RLQGHVAHIVGSSAKGPRGDEKMQGRVDAASNLLLLCPNHHALVDAEPEVWTVERLRTMKAEHEDWVARQLIQGENATFALGSPYFINLRRVLLDPAARGIRPELDDLDLNSLESFNSLDFNSALRVMTAVERLLQEWSGRAIDLATTE